MLQNVRQATSWFELPCGPSKTGNTSSPMIHHVHHTETNEPLRIRETQCFLRQLKPDSTSPRGHVYSPGVCCWWRWGQGCRSWGGLHRGHSPAEPAWGQSGPCPSPRPQGCGQSTWTALPSSQAWWPGLWIAQSWGERRGWMGHRQTHTAPPCSVTLGQLERLRVPGPGPAGPFSTARLWASHLASS